jgi:hypothetical protein
MRRRRKRRRSPKVVNFSKVEEGIETVIDYLSALILFYTELGGKERFGEFWQIKTSSAGDLMLQWEDKRPACKN